MANEPYLPRQTGTAADAPFVAIAMFTKDYAAKAERLAASLDKFGLAHALFEVPSVHRSISPKGGNDLTYSKPVFITWALRRFQRPLLYLDADCEIKERPELIWTLHREQTDFSAYNWLADLMNDAWVPEPNVPGVTASGAPRYWCFSHAIDDYATTQLNCSGAVQYWRDSDSAFRLLAAWKQAITVYPRLADDECLRVAFNRAPGGWPHLRYFWLPKEYARYLFWIYARPVIDHADIPTLTNSTHFDTLDRGAYDAAQITPRIGKARPFPRSCILDVGNGAMLLRQPDGTLKPIARLPMPLYL
jgi:hypothetical protein